MKLEEQSVEYLTEQRGGIVIRLKELENEIRSIGLSANQERFKPHTVLPEKKALKDKLTAEFRELQIKSVTIREELHKRKQGSEERKDCLMQILQESFPKEVFDACITEYERRKYGHPPSLVRVNLAKEDKENIASLKKVLKNYNKILLDARVALTTYMSENMPTNNKGEFMKGLSGVNSKIPPVNELERDRRLFNF